MRESSWGEGWLPGLLVELVVEVGLGGTVMSGSGVKVVVFVGKRGMRKEREREDVAFRGWEVRDGYSVTTVRRLSFIYIYLAIAAGSWSGGGGDLGCSLWRVARVVARHISVL